MTDIEPQARPLAFALCAGLALASPMAKAQDPHQHGTAATAQPAKKKLPAVPPLPGNAAPPPAPAPAPGIAPAKPAPAPAPPMSAPQPKATAPASVPTAPAKPEHMGHGTMEHHAARQSGLLGIYPMSRDASGTSWQPDASPHAGMHASAGGWDLMGHVNLGLVYDRQSGPRGDDKTFPTGMIMGSARRDIGPGTLNLRAMLSPEPFMGKRGYPLLLAAGETADGTTTLVDRQHPHDLLMELAGSYSLRLADDVSLFVYGGDPAEPALGPPAFMHRPSSAELPAPITHHWLDSTHIVFGVVTAGLVAGDFKFEASQFTGREPDEKRFDFDRARFDSTSLRITWNPGENWSLQVSAGRLNSPEGLTPSEDEKRWTASLIYVRPIGEDQMFAMTLAGGLKQYEHGDDLGGALAEASYRVGNFTFFGRAEWAENHDLNPGTVEEIGAGSLGGVYDIPLAPHVKIGIGGVATRPFLDNATGAFEASYGSNPHGEMAFIRLRLD